MSEVVVDQFGTEPVEPRRVEENGILVLQAGADQSFIKLIRKNGVLVASVEPAGDLEHAVERDRQARIEKQNTHLCCEE